MKVNRDGSFSFGHESLFAGAIESLRLATNAFKKAGDDALKEWQIADLRRSCGVELAPLTVKLTVPKGVNPAGEGQ